MATVNPSKFQNFSFSDEEELVAKAFNPLNILYLNNLRYEVAKELITLTPENMTTAEKELFFTRHAFLMGKFTILNDLINDGE